MLWSSHIQHCTAIFHNSLGKSEEWIHFVSGLVQPLHGCGSNPLIRRPYFNLEVSSTSTRTSSPTGSESRPKSEASTFEWVVTEIGALKQLLGRTMCCGTFLNAVEERWSGIAAALEVSPIVLPRRPDRGPLTQLSTRFNGRSEQEQRTQQRALLWKSDVKLCPAASTHNPMHFRVYTVSICRATPKTKNKFGPMLHTHQRECALRFMGFCGNGSF